MLHTLRAAGWDIFWLIPYRGIFFLLYAAGWLILLRPVDPQRQAGLGFLFWVTAVREAIDRLLPVASVGGAVMGVRLVCWRGLHASAVSASVVVEIVLTLVASYVFTAMGLLLLLEAGAGREYRHLAIAFLLTLPIPILTALLLRYGSVAARLQKLLRPLLKGTLSPGGAAAFDAELRAALDRRRRLTFSGATQLLALISGSFEIWWALRLFGHPIDAGAAIALESMTLAVRHVAFVVPAGLGVQEAGLVLFGHALGIDSELALAVSMAKRLREVVWGLPALISWQWLEGRRLHHLSRNPC
jgi:putative membrane protein